MKRHVGETLILRELEDYPQKIDYSVYEIVENRMIKPDFSTVPIVTGRFIEVEVKRNFRVNEVSTLEIQELD